MSHNLIIKPPHGFDKNLKVPQIGTVDTFRILGPEGLGYQGPFQCLDRYILYLQNQQRGCKKTPYYTSPEWEMWQERIDLAEELREYCLTHRVLFEMSHV